jgi:hypothetical protein
VQEIDGHIVVQRIELIDARPAGGFEVVGDLNLV